MHLFFIVQSIRGFRAGKIVAYGAWPCRGCGSLPHTWESSFLTEDARVFSMRCPTRTCTAPGREGVSGRGTSPMPHAATFLPECLQALVAEWNAQCGKDPVCFV